MSEKSYYISDLRSKFTESKVAIFIGAGLSVGAGLPDWDQFVVDLAAESGVPEDWNYLMIAEAFVKLPNGKAKLFSRIRERLLLPTQLTETQKMVARLPTKVFVTTNYDFLFDNALNEERGRVLPVWTSSQLPFYQDILYIKLHGDLNDPNSIALTKSNYRRHFREEESLFSELQSIFAKNVVLFLGYSHRDPDIEFIIEEIRHKFGEFGQPIYSVQFDADRERVKYLALSGITVINLHARDKSNSAREKALQEFLHELTSESGWALPPRSSTLPPVATFSTGQARVAVKKQLQEYLEKQDTFSQEKIIKTADGFQRKQRGRMVPFEVATHLNREFTFIDLLQNDSTKIDYLQRYLDAFFEKAVADSYEKCSRNLAAQINSNDTLAITEYSRVIRRALETLSKESPSVFSSLTFIVVHRGGLLLVEDEPSRMADEIKDMGGEPISISFDQWVEFMLGHTKQFDFQRIDKVLFGVEGFLENGDVIFPQVVKEMEQLGTARQSRNNPLSDAKIIAAGESYKVCKSDSEILNILTDPHYSIINHTYFDSIVTDIETFLPGPERKFDLSRCLEHIDSLCDDVRPSIWPKGNLLPIRNLSKPICRRIKLVVCDIDGTITEDQKIPEKTLRSFSRLREVGVDTVLVTGRSAEWASALTCYLPGILGIIAENGGVYIEPADSEVKIHLISGLMEKDIPKIQAKLQQCFAAVKLVYPEATLASDNFGRMTDLTFKVVPGIDPEVIRRIAKEHRIEFTYSNIHFHLQGTRLDKGSALLVVADRYLRIDSSQVKDTVATIGDSVNDKSLFDKCKFSVTIGVRNILSELNVLGTTVPIFVTLNKEAEGFEEVAKHICSCH